MGSFSGGALSGVLGHLRGLLMLRSCNMKTINYYAREMVTLGTVQLNLWWYLRGAFIDLEALGRGNVAKRAL